MSEVLDQVFNVKFCFRVLLELCKYKTNEISIVDKNTRGLALYNFENFKIPSNDCLKGY